MPEVQPDNSLKRLPPVGTLVKAMNRGTVIWAGHELAVAAARATLTEARMEWRSGGAIPDLSVLVSRANAFLAVQAYPTLTHVINATGIILHTGLGRAAMAFDVGGGLDVRVCHSNLEVDMETGERGSRQTHVAPHLTALTGADAAIVVNNDAGAVLLALAAIARGREVIVSRGELVEIGGGFRIPEILAESGATMVEVGTTNKTRLRDYERAITPNTAALLKVHPSNFRVIGFTESVGIPELAGLAERAGLPLLDDLGSGALVDVGLGEPTVQDRVAEGADLVMFSGDKLLGGPQAGISVGRKDLIDKMSTHPLARALRCDKVTISLLQKTLILYRRGAAWRTIPTLHALVMTPDEARANAETLAASLAEISGVEATVVESECRVGAGALPEHPLPSFAVSVNVNGMGPNSLAAALRANSTPIFAHVTGECLLIEVRTMLRHSTESKQIGRALRRIAMERKETTE